MIEGDRGVIFFFFLASVLQLASDKTPVNTNLYLISFEVLSRLYT